MRLPYVPNKHLDDCLWHREELEQVEVFKYLGWLIAYNDANNQAIRSNLRKARGCWA
jgi:hypothetical protein